LVKAAQKLGLELYHGNKHINAKQIHSNLKVQIPRHNKIKRETARGIVEFLIIRMKFPEEIVAKALGVDPPLLSQKKKENPPLIR